MRGYPKHLNTREDYEFVLANFAKEDYYKDFENLLNTRYDWITTGELSSKEDGIDDDTHQVLTEDGDDGTTRYYQMELKYNKNCRMEQLGYTEEEIKNILEGQD